MTSLFGGRRVSKAHIRIDSYGTVDELNSWIGVLRDQSINSSRKEVLIAIQDRLLTIGSNLAVEPGNTKVKVPPMIEADVAYLEREIDKMEQSLPPMRSFVLPGGHEAVSFTHVARTVCRRAERLVIALQEAEGVDPVIVHYLNRLSDYLFVLARITTADLGTEETSWLPKM